MKQSHPLGQAEANGQPEPKGEMVIRTLCMPKDTNPAGDIFGGWLMSQMDIAGGVFAAQRARGRVATVAADAMSFHLPVRVGDVIACFAEVVHVGHTSLKVRVEAWALRERIGNREKVTEGVFAFVALDEDGNKRPVPK
ncbi:MAG: acyl-CoA thioesterase [Magnetovibrionaceae bacterium]